jgi:hypothetical protein
LADLVRRAQTSAIGGPLRPVDPDERQTPHWYDIEEELAAGEVEYVDRLSREEDALAAAGVEAPSPAHFWITIPYAVLAFAVVVVPALATRILTWPFRGLARERAWARRARRTEQARAEIVALTEQLRATPDDVALRNQRGLWLLAGGLCAIADREFANCLERIGADGPTTLAIAHQNMAVARNRLKLPRLSRRSEQTAIAAGFAPGSHVLARRLWGFVTLPAAMFLVLGGLGPE